MKRAIFFDIDGTLIDCLNGLTDMTPRVKKAIRGLQANGDYVFIATGRPYAFISEALLNFGFDGFVLTNGAQVNVKDKWIYNDPIAQDFVREVVSHFEEFNIQYVLQGDVYSYIKEKHEELYLYYDNYAISRKYLQKNFNIEDIHIYKIEMLSKDERGRDYCLSLKSDHYNCIQDSEEKYFELYSKKNTKATGILKILDYLNIEVKNSYAFGDGKNDIEMLSTVGCGIAMGNASDEIKSYANKVTDTVRNDGIALAIKRFIL